MTVDSDYSKRKTKLKADLEQKIAVALYRRPAVGEATAGPGRVIPRELPARVRAFTGREQEMAALSRLLEDAGAPR